MYENIVEKLFKTREENIFINTDKQKEILGEEIIKLNNITNLIDDENIVSQLLKYENQCNLINAEYNEIFYKQRFFGCYANII